MRISELFTEEEMDNDAKSWLKELGLTKQGKIRKDGSIDFATPLVIPYGSLGQFAKVPFKLNRVHSIQIKDNRLTSFKNFPATLTYAAGDTLIKTDMWGLNLHLNSQGSEFKNLESLEGITPVIPGGVNLRHCPNLNYSHVDNYIKEVQQAFTIHNRYVGPILSFLKIKKLRYVFVYGVDKDTPIGKALDILNNHLEPENRDILGCQEELLEAGLKYYAKL